jgi:DNA-binding response OmpR family regulator
LGSNFFAPVIMSLVRSCGILGYGHGGEMSIAKARHKTILFVDDELALHRAIDHAASAIGIDVIHATTGFEAIRLAMAERLDLIILDMTLPDLDGFQVLDCLKREPQTSAIPVVIFSGCCDHDDRIIAFQSGADDYFEKPLDLCMLMRRVEHHIFKNSETLFARGASRPTDDTVPRIKRLA